MDPNEIFAYSSHVLEYALTVEREQMRARCIHHSDSKWSLVEMKRAGEEGSYDYQWAEAEQRIQ